MTELNNYALMHTKTSHMKHRATCG